MRNNICMVDRYYIWIMMDNGGANVSLLKDNIEI